MKIKAICLILTALVTVLSLVACGKAGGSKNDTESDTKNANPTYIDGGHTLYVRDENSGEHMTATFKKAGSDEVYEVDMEQVGSGEGYTEFSCSADAAAYDRVVLSGDNSGAELAFNEYVDGWTLNQYHYMPYCHDSKSAEPQYERQQFDYDGRIKDVLIWTPEDYDASSKDKYAVIYMTDAQNLFKYDATATGSWAVAESALAMAKKGGQKCIIVGIENADGWRDDELTPNIGEVLDPAFDDGHGKYFSDFVVDTVMPYINEHYNVYTDREHTHICGSSSGGIESFYIAMEHPDKFASVGALSPAFLLFDDATWVKYLGEKDFSKNTPFIYLYCGNGASDSLEQSLYTGTVSMPDTLQKIGYPEDKVVLKLSENAIHNEMYWRAVFPDYLKYAFPQA